MGESQNETKQAFSKNFLYNSIMSYEETVYEITSLTPPEADTSQLLRPSCYDFDVTLQ
jgi:hypothetical protein